MHRRGLRTWTGALAGEVWAVVRPELARPWTQAQQVWSQQRPQGVAAKGPCLPGWQKGLHGASRPLGLGRGPRAGRSPYIEVGSVAGFPSVKPATNEWINKQGLSTRQKVVRMTRNRMNREDRVLGERPGPKGHVV